ncbi:MULTISPECIES: LysR family transcriptional regulator [Ectothiorhodospira]|uniref:DNA-binding transcriptional regulator, LysR family n=1 Tax=Ectothiorhodospira marina TaxID=1396821 RepID=A0A1H7NLK1_9GAMM|nr:MULTISPECIES: LysR family transcriptional regulator [Ectothiorhodospira]MCG5516299.1 LysR substrate-binding domain-containing protein [Ectothiorhodospira sp. 9100]MCG5519322.1 LysR substrate-binding domain-containing protein [Ectothiorhodospira sp. 9905]SEL23875.1 DNA-binding transcriptional regulator, LysR family [Ectothiorhodospira marina]
MADRRLQVFYTVARLLSFTKAAEALHMTQPAVTFQVRQLEEHFNTRLFDRTHNRVSLTEAGRAAFRYAERIFEAYGEMENAIREITGDVSGALTLGASTTIAEYMLPALLGNFKRKHPEVNIRLKVANSEGIVSMVENNIIDLGVVEGPVSNRNLQVEVCQMDQLVVIVPPGHPLAGKASVTMEEVLPYPFICREEGSGTREVIADYLIELGMGRNALTVSLELGSPEAIKGAVEAGMGVSILSRATLDKELALNRLEGIPLEPGLTRQFAFVHQRQKFRLRAVEELLSFARDYCDRQPSGDGASTGHPSSVSV